MPVFQRSETVNLYYEISGQGEPILMVHGFMGTGRTEFPDIVEWLSQDYKVIAPDLQGYGKSAPKPREYGVDFYRRDAEDLVALLEHLELPPTRVLGFSDGGEIAFWLPILAPGRIRSVVSWGAIGHFTDEIRPSVLAHLSMSWRTAKTDERHGAEHIQEMASRWVAAMLAMIDRGGDITLSRAGEIACPVLVILGDKDKLNPAAQGKAMADAIPKGKFSLYKGTGHSVHREQPQKFQKEVGRFLKKT